MVWILNFLIFGHFHKWIIIKESRLTAPEGYTGTRFILQCEKCGNVKMKDCI